MLAFLFDQHHPGPHPIRAYAFLEYSEIGDLIDILTCDPIDGAIRSWTGAAWCWGAETIRRPRLGVEAIPVHRKPSRRLRARKLDGFVPLRPQTLLYHVLGIPALIAEDNVHRVELQRHFQALVPRILLPEEVCQ